MSTCRHTSSSSGETLAKLLASISQHKLLMALSLVLAAGTVVLQLYIPILFGNAIDHIIAPGNVNFEALQRILTQAAGLILVCSLASWVMSIINNRLAFHTVKDIRERCIRQLQRLPLSYIDAHSTGDLTQRIIADTDQLSDGLLLGFSQLFSGVITIVATLGFMLSKSVGITMLVALLTPLSFVVARFIATRSYTMFAKQTATRGKQSALVSELIGNQKLVKAFGYEQRASQRFAAVNSELKAYSQRAVFYSSLTNPSTRAVNNVIYALVTLVGAWRISAGQLSIGGLAVLLAYANQYMKPFNDISSVVTEMQAALACAGRVFALIEAEPEVADSQRELVVAGGQVELCKLSFSYDKKTPIIKDFSFTAAPGTKTALVGPTGCGKTTLINLLMRFYDCDTGSIAIDEQKLHEVSRASLRKSFGMVLQDSWIKRGTVRENIAFGRPNATDEEIIAAACEAHSWEFIRRMPEKLDTIIDEESLSQGQKQLLCITRIMLCVPPMLILDEATSSIDTRTELQIQEAFDKLMQGRTSFVVAHRLSTIREADQILVMRDGQIVEQGRHEELLVRGGFYAELYNAQFVTGETSCS